MSLDSIARQGLPLLPSERAPAWRRVCEALRRAVVSGALAPGRRLPSTRDLAGFYGVSRNTILQAYEQLTAEGYLEGRRGSGTYVLASLPEGFLQVAPAAPEASRKQTRSASRRQLAPPPFLSGISDLESFPAETWLKLQREFVRSSPYSLSGYGHELGYEPLRAAIAGHLSSHRGVVCSPGQILVLSGSLPGIELSARALTGPGDVVAIETPCYPGSAQALRLHGASVVGVPVDEGGISIDALRALPKPPRLVVVTPSRQFPLGYSMPFARRVELLRWARESKAWILEDDYDSEFRFRGNPFPALQGLDTEGRTLYLGTFSKTMFPDLRIGYLTMPDFLRDSLVAFWRAGARGPPIATQATLAAFFERGHYLRHIRAMRALYARRCRALATLVEGKLGRWLELGPTDGGLHFVAFARPGFDADALAARAREKGVLLNPVSKYDVGKPSRPGLVFGYASYGERAMKRAVAALQEAFEEA